MVPNLSGYYRFVSQENMDNYLRALDINVVLRKVVCLLKPDKEIIHTGDHMVIRTAGDVLQPVPRSCGKGW